MTKMSTGDDATLGNYRKMAAAVFGEDSKPVKFLDDKIAASPNGANEEVIADNWNDYGINFAHVVIGWRGIKWDAVEPFKGTENGK